MWPTKDYSALLTQLNKHTYDNVESNIIIFFFPKSCLKKNYFTVWTIPIAINSCLQKNHMFPIVQNQRINSFIQQAWISTIQVKLTMLFEFFLYSVMKSRIFFYGGNMNRAESRKVKSHLAYRHNLIKNWVCMDCNQMNKIRIDAIAK